MLDDLARRAVASPDWRWMPGMRTTTGTRVLLVEDDGAYVLGIPAGWHQPILLEAQYLPDLADPATVGCLLALVREARGESTGFLAPAKGGGWRYWTRLYPADYFHGDTEAEALVTALEAGP